MIWVEVKKLSDGWKLVYSGGDISAQRGLYLETPAPDLQKVQIFHYLIKEDNRFVTRYCQIFSHKYPNAIPEAVKEEVEEHFRSRFVEVVTREIVGDWQIVNAIQQGERRIWIDSLVASIGISDNPIRYRDGSISYSNPKEIPDYVKIAVSQDYSAKLSDIVERVKQKKLGIKEE